MTTINSNGSDLRRTFGLEPTPRQLAMNMLRQVFARNAFTLRSDLRRLSDDPRRDIDDECGYPKSPINLDLYQDYYERHPLAARVVDVWPEECWQESPEVYEDEDANTETDFESGWDELGKGLAIEPGYQCEEEGSAIWTYLERLDRLAGIGHYGVLLLGLDDRQPLSRPAAGMEEIGSVSARREPDGRMNVPDNPSRNYRLVSNATGKGGQRRLRYLRALPEHLAQVSQWEANPDSPRYCQPVSYLLTLQDPRLTSSSTVGLPTGMQEVHWTRVIHFADGDHEWLAAPRMQAVFNNLYATREIYGADGEAFWRHAFLKLFMETHESLGGDVDIDTSALMDEFEKMMNGSQQFMALRGLHANAIPPAVADPGPHLAAHIEAICIKLGIPMRIFKGSERGQLASEQDERAWDRRKARRQRRVITPRIVQPFVNRLINCGVLPPPSEYYTAWPDTTIRTAVEGADILLKRTQAMSAYISGGGESLMAPMDYLTREMEYSEDEAEAILEGAMPQDVPPEEPAPIEGEEQQTIPSEEGTTSDGGGGL